MMVKLILTAFYLALPIYLANMAPPLFYKLFNHSPWLKPFNQPIHSKIFGDHKTWQGILTGTIIAILTSSIQALLYQLPAFQNISLLPYPKVWLVFGFLAGLGAMLSDLFKSFIKRRIKIASGEPWLIFDQLDFVAGFLLFTWWLIRPDLLIVMTIIVLTLIVHPLTNVIGWAIKIKRHPW